MMTLAKHTHESGVPMGQIDVRCTCQHMQFVHENKILKRTSVSMKRLERKPDAQLTQVSLLQ